MAFIPIGDLIVPQDHPCLPGHFPGRPIVPGVLILQAVADKIAGRWPAKRLREVAQAKFLSLLLPDEQCVIFIDDADDIRVRFECRENDRLIASGMVLLEDRP